MSAAYLAAEPGLYRTGLVRLFGPAQEEWADDTIVAVAQALRYWLLGQFIEMAHDRRIDDAGGMADRAAVSARSRRDRHADRIRSLSRPDPGGDSGPAGGGDGGLDKVVWTLVAYILIHQIEGNLIMPQIQKRMVYIPPALMLIGIAGLGALAGILGFVFAAPMMVAIFVVVQKAYVRDTLKEEITLPGEKHEEPENARRDRGRSSARFTLLIRNAPSLTPDGLHSVRRALYESRP